MTKIRPYLALDIETTGLDVFRSQILQIGWVIDDGVSPINDLQKGSIFIDHGEITYGESYALGMNAWIFQELAKPKKERKYETFNTQGGLYKLYEAITDAAAIAHSFDESMGIKKDRALVQIAGKNIANFDWPIIVNQARVNAFPPYKFPVDHRFIDCGAVFFNDFGKNPGFGAINKLIGYKDITHDALDDALNVVVALRYKAGVPL